MIDSPVKNNEKNQKIYCEKKKKSNSLLNIDNLDNEQQSKDNKFVTSGEGMVCFSQLSELQFNQYLKAIGR